MLLIPIHLLIDDSKTKLPSFFNEKLLGVSRKTIENYINKKSTPTQNSLNQIKHNLIRTKLMDEKSIDIIISLFLNFNSSCDWHAETLNSLIANSTCYSQNELYKLVDIDHRFKQDFISNGGFNITTTGFIQIINKYTKIEPIKTIYGSFHHSNYTIKASLNLLRFDVILYLLSAFEHDFAGENFHRQSGLINLIPYVENEKLIHPYRNLIDLMMKKYKILSINELAKKVSESELDYIKNKRFINKIRSHIKIHDPEHKSIENIIIKILKNNSIEFKKNIVEINFCIYSTKILNRLLIWTKKLKIFESDQDIAAFFSRYKMWFNYHNSRNCLQGQ